jgi:hypothetical protein
MRHHSVKGATPKMDTQMTYLRPTRSPMGSTQQCSQRSCKKKGKQVKLRVLDGNTKFMHQVKRIEVGETGHVDVFRENKYKQNK